MSNIQNKTVLVTGGASGIGKLMGEPCSKEGPAALIIWDINKDNLLKVSEELIGKDMKYIFTRWPQQSPIKSLNMHTR